MLVVVVVVVVDVISGVFVDVCGVVVSVLGVEEVVESIRDRVESNSFNLELKVGSMSINGLFWFRLLAKASSSDRKTVGVVDSTDKGLGLPLTSLTSDSSSDVNCADILVVVGGSVLGDGVALVSVLSVTNVVNFGVTITKGVVVGLGTLSRDNNLSIVRLGSVCSEAISSKKLLVGSKVVEVRAVKGRRVVPLSEVTKVLPVPPVVLVLRLEAVLEGGRELSLTRGSVLATSLGTIVDLAILERLSVGENRTFESTVLKLLPTCRGSTVALSEEVSALMADKELNILSITVVGFSVVLKSKLFEIKVCFCWIGSKVTSFGRFETKFKMAELGVVCL